MTETEKKFIELAIHYIEQANDAEKYSMEREICLSFVNDILHTLKEGEDYAKKKAIEQICSF